MTTIAQALWADNSNMTQKLQWRQMEYLNHHFIWRCLACDGSGYPAERFAEALAARMAASA